MSPSASGTGLDSEHETVNRTDLPFTVDLLCVGRGGKWKWLCPLRETWERVAVRWGGSGSVLQEALNTYVSGSFPAALWAARLGAVTATFTNECCINGNRVTFLGVTYRGSCKVETRSRFPSYSQSPFVTQRAA